MRSMLRILVPALAAALALGGCASSPGGGSGGDDTPAPRIRRSNNEITPEEIEALNVNDLYAAIRQLHPEWLRTGVGVFVNGMRMGGPEALSRISTTERPHVRYLNERQTGIEMSRTSTVGLSTVILVDTRQRSR